MYVKETIYTYIYIRMCVYIIYINSHRYKLNLNKDRQQQENSPQMILISHALSMDGFITLEWVLCSI